MSAYREILNLLNKSVISNQVVYTIFRLLDDYTCNPVHDEIFDLLFEFLVSKNSALLKDARQICINNLEI